jgi:1-acyl-sn-glycerol-3-phosphate acyltransferase
MHHVPRQGPALLIANHQSYIDPILIGLAARRRLNFLARKTLFHKGFYTWLMTSMGTIPVDQEGFAREGLQTLIQLLKTDHAAAIFPEGERTHTGRMQELRPGVHLLIKKAPAPIVPIGIAGAYESWPRTRSLPILAPLFCPANQACMAVSVGRPLDGQLLAEKSRAEVLQTLFDALQTVQQRAEKLRRKPTW